MGLFDQRSEETNWRRGRNGRADVRGPVANGSSGNGQGRVVVPALETKRLHNVPDKVGGIKSGIFRKSSALFLKFEVSPHFEQSSVAIDQQLERSSL